MPVSQWARVYGADRPVGGTLTVTALRPRPGGAERMENNLLNLLTETTYGLLMTPPHASKFCRCSASVCAKKWLPSFLVQSTIKK